MVGDAQDTVAELLLVLTLCVASHDSQVNTGWVSRVGHVDQRDCLAVVSINACTRQFEPGPVNTLVCSVPVTVDFEIDELCVNPVADVLDCCGYLNCGFISAEDFLSLELTRVNGITRDTGDTEIPVASFKHALLADITVIAW